MRNHFDTFEKVYPEKYQAQYGYWRPVIRTSIDKFIKCGDVKEGFARVRCPNCGGKMKIISFIERHQSVVIEKVFTPFRKGKYSNPSGLYYYVICLFFGTAVYGKRHPREHHPVKFEFLIYLPGILSIMSSLIVWQAERHLNPQL